MQKSRSSLFHPKGESNVFLLIDAYVSHLMRLCLQPDSPREPTLIFGSHDGRGGKRAETAPAKLITRTA